jgi:hypothetical protein
LRNDHSRGRSRLTRTARLVRRGIPKHPPGPPMTLGNMRELKFRRWTDCQRCESASGPRGPTIAVAHTHPLTDLLRDCAIWPAMSIEAMNPRTITSDMMQESPAASSRLIPIRRPLLLITV